jgi:hypothetical protein
MNIEKILESKAYYKPGSGIEFKTPEVYLSKTLDKLSKYTDKFNVKVAGSVTNVNEDGSTNTAYGRVLIEPDFSNTDKMYKTVGFLYALDIQRPVVKVYTGSIVTACTNLCIFNAEHLFEASIMDGGFDKSYDILDTYLENMGKTLGEYYAIKENLEAQLLPEKEINTYLGKLLEFGIKNSFIGTTPIVQAGKELYSADSKYYIGKDKITSKWNIYNAITDNLKKADIKDAASKVLKISNFILN